MSQNLRVFVYSLAIVFACAAPACAADEAGHSLITLTAAIGAAATIIGASYGIGKIGTAALEGMARQPEAAPQIQTAMIIAAALIEGATFFALIVCLIK